MRKTQSSSLTESRCESRPLVIRLGNVGAELSKFQDLMRLYKTEHGPDIISDIWCKDMQLNHQTIDMTYIVHICIALWMDGISSEITNHQMSNKVRFIS